MLLKYSRMSWLFHLEHLQLKSVMLSITHTVTGLIYIFSQCGLECYAVRHLFLSPFCLAQTTVQTLIEQKVIVGDVWSFPPIIVTDKCNCCRMCEYDTLDRTAGEFFNCWLEAYAPMGWFGNSSARQMRSPLAFKNKACTWSSWQERAT